MPRSSIPKLDLLYKNQLVENEKIISENMIIVDLLRNDLSILAKPSTLEVKKLFSLETYETLHQMTSHISCEVDKNLSFIKIFKQIFPCGSITGAPKKRTMQIIHELESEPRHIYTGCIGYITPENDMCFNVAIRTFYLKDNVGELGIGGGVTFDSNAMDEYNELQLKAKFFTDFKLIESIRYQENTYYFLDEHLQRLKTSAHHLEFIYPLEKIKEELNLIKNHMGNKTYKVRLILSKSGDLNTQYETLAEIPPNPMIMLYEQEYILSTEPLLQHKTTWSATRDFYQEVKSRYPEYFDVLFMNENHEITETSMANIIIVKDNMWYTPPMSSGILPGIMRQNILLKDKNCKEKVLYKKDLLQADKIYLINSVRGMIEVHLCQNYSS